MLRVPGRGAAAGLAGGQPGRARARPARRTPRRLRSVLGAPLLEQLRRRRLRPARHRHQRAGRLPHRRRARHLPRLRPLARRRGRGRRGSSGWSPRSAAAASADDAELAAHVSTIEAARDMDVLRSALGPRAARLLRQVLRHQARRDLRRAVPRARSAGSSSTAPSTCRCRSRELSLGQAEGFETALRAYVDNCVETDRLLLPRRLRRRGAGPDHRLPRRGRRRAAADPGRARAHRSATPSTASSRRSTTATTGPSCPRALRAGFDGDGTALLQLADVYSSRGPEAATPTTAARRSSRSTASTTRTPLPAERVPAQLAAFREVSPTFGDVFAWGLTGCLGQVAESTEEPLEIDGAGAAPIVVIGTTRDPATPYAWAEALADQLDSGGAGQPRRRRPHRLPVRQRLRRRGGRGLLPRRARCPRTGCPAEAQRGLTGSAIDWIRRVASSIISRAAVESVAPARCTIGEGVELPRPQRRQPGVRREPGQQLLGGAARDRPSRPAPSRPARRRSRRPRPRSGSAGCGRSRASSAAG